LKENDQSFWKTTQATIKSYKRFHLDRHSKKGEFVIKRVTAQLYLVILKHFIAYWRGIRDDDPLFTDYISNIDGQRARRKSRGDFSNLSWYSRVPNDLWQIVVRPEEKHTKKRYKGLSNEDGKTVMMMLNKAAHHTDIETMLFYRNRAVWAFMLMSMMRKGELVRIRLEDLDRRAGVIYLIDRPEDRWLGDLKTGPGEIFVTTRNPYWQFVNSWLTEGRWIAEKLIKSKGMNDHGMLFCNRDGGPMTQAAIDYLFICLKEACGFSKSKQFFPHITRHTMASLMIDLGVDIEEVQQQLRHVCISSTIIYAKISTQQLRASMTKFWQKVRV
jgi:site-specific recombinase XerD